VSCAPAGVGNGSNLGMNTVDLAAHSIVSELNLEDQVTLCRPWPSYIKDKHGRYSDGYSLDAWPMKFDYSWPKLGGKQTFDSVVYWGDFQHGFDYVNQTAVRAKSVAAKQNIRITAEESEDNSIDYFLLTDEQRADSSLDVAMFGGTLFQNRLSDYLDSSYTSKLFELYGKAKFVRMRDPYSSSKVAEMRGDYESSFLGVDAAFLNRPEELLALQQSGSEAMQQFEGSVGVFFGRSSRRFPWVSTARFILGMSKRLKTDVCWIDWGRHSGGLLSPILKLLRWLLPGMKQIGSEVEWTSGDVLESIKRSSVIITDTYHLAINAMILNIPCVCIFDPSPNSERDANMGYHVSWRDKRVLLYLTSELSDFLVSATDLKSKRWRTMRLDNIVNLISDIQVTRGMYANVNRAAMANRQAVSSYLKRAAEEG